MSDEIRDHGKVVTAPAGTSQEAVIDKLTGADKLPPIGQELGRPASAPPFDPHEGREVDTGREHGDEAEPMISTLVFMGVDYGGDFEDSIQALVIEAEKLGLHYVAATVSKLDLHAHFEALDSMDMDGLESDDEDDEQS